MPYNIKQINHTTTAGASIEPKQVTIAGNITVNHNYYVFGSRLLGLEGDQSITKLGYCCKDNYGKDFPIFLTIKNGNETETIMFYPGKEGMYEFQPEDWEDVNNIITKSDGTQGPEDGKAIIEVTKVEIPVGFEFVLDYCYEE